MAKNFLTLINTFPNNQKYISHIITPWCKSTIAIHDDILEWLKTLLIPLFHPEADLVVDVILELIVVPDDLGNFVAKVDGLGEEGSDLLIEMFET